jgi:hypothetical protein
MSNVSPTEAQQITLLAVNYVYGQEYTEPPTFAPDFNLPQRAGEVTMGTIEHLPEAAVALREQSGVYNALQMLFYNFRRFEQQGGEIDEWAFLLLVEDWALRELLFTDNGDGTGTFKAPDAVLFRGCAFFEHYFETELDWAEYTDDDEPSFAKLINIAAYDDVDVITPLEQKLFHLIREVRNDIAHHAWLSRNYSFDAVVYAARSLMYLIGEFLGRYVPDMGLEPDESWDQIDPAAEYLTPVEEEFGWEYDSRRKYWRTTDIDEMPPL